MTNYTHQTAPTQFVEAAGIRFAYRRFANRRFGAKIGRRSLSKIKYLLPREVTRLNIRRLEDRYVVPLSEVICRENPRRSIASGRVS
jgi:hypothetical protein